VAPAVDHRSADRQRRPAHRSEKYPSRWGKKPQSARTNNLRRIRASPLSGKQNSRWFVITNVSAMWQRTVGTAAILLCLLAGAVKTLDLVVRLAPLPPPAARFLTHWEALGARPPASLWERLTFSWLLSRAEASRHPRPARSGSG
jgi:hypothetical protein